VPQLQDHPPQGCGARDLHRPAPQAASRLRLDVNESLLTRSRLPKAFAPASAKAD